MKVLKTLLPILTFFFASVAVVFAQPAARDTLIPAADLKADVAILRRAYEELHPGLYRYNSKTQMDANFAWLESEISRDRTLSEAYLAFSIFTAKLKCGHSYANFFNQPKAISRALFQQQDKVPFYFRWLNGRMIVSKNFSIDPSLTPGTEIVSINGVNTKEILANLMTVARADGSNDAKRVAYLEVLGNDRFEAFDVFYPLFYPLKSTKFELNVRPFAKTKTNKVVVDALTYDQRLAAMSSAADTSKPDAPLFTVSYLESDIAVLRMPSWALYDSKWDWKKFVNETMNDLANRKVANLVIDVRGNEGGLDVGNEVITHLITKDLRLAQMNRFVRYRKLPADLKPYLYTWDRSFDDWGAGASDPKNGFYRLTRYDDDAYGNVLKPSGQRYSGRVFVLVGPTNSSATFEFAQTIKLNKLGTLVGQPTGGNQRGINGGAFYFLNLPKSKIEVDLPLIGQFPVGDAPDAGIEPDVFVKPRASDIAFGRDVEMDAVKQILKRRK